MIFNLSCPECLQVNEIEADEMVVDWVCQYCKSQPTTSLGVNENGDLTNG
jgi:hypothetical protein